MFQKRVKLGAWCFIGLMGFVGTPAIAEEPGVLKDAAAATPNAAAAKGQSLTNDYRSFVDDLIAQETQPAIVTASHAEPTVQDPALLGASEHSAPAFEPALHFVGVNRLGSGPLLAEIFYRGTTSHYELKSVLPTGQALSAITHTSITLSQTSQDDEDTTRTTSVVLPLTSIKEAQQERQRFKDDASFYQSLGLGSR